MTDETLKSSPLQALHEELKATMGCYAGYALPEHYPLGMEVEHLHTRKQAGLFDISFLGQVRIRAKEDNAAVVAEALEALMPLDIMGLEKNRVRYGLLTTDQGGIRDDLAISRQEEEFILTLNGQNREDNADYLENAIGNDCRLIREFDRAMLSLQGPLSAEVLARVLDQTTIMGMRYRDSLAMQWEGGSLIVSRFGYTGMEGFDLSLEASQAEAFARRLLDDPDVAPAGLETRNSLRMEAGLCLYGADIDKTTSPVEAALVSSIAACRRAGGARAGGYPGAGTIEGQMEHGVYRQRVGLRPEGDVLLGGGVELFSDEGRTDRVGRITSGCFSPTLRAMIAMAYVTPSHAAEGTVLYAADADGQLHKVSVTALPFVPQTAR
ncbi:glycine cleavage system protein T [Parasaccharibacter sp. TMW2.1882]|uniref:Aminomethyltransferase (Glycine cleavage system T protein) n=4 Tax=Acetobacteraceae TaxID=433 RepID=A0A7U7G5L5_9PROT|nr:MULTISPECIES: glycine cleavage T C-terminal barrel domain-containing protein [Acetobacteraceae]MCL1563438.1 glycine cleavage system aminomethyltransferase GcvT [Parasaccharibacter sp. TMW 2.1886]MCQ0041764.1 glycine cleavage system aminomethyltransferase GcvT [Bombella sp.]MUG80277.1 glycine cleavage system aminomethyltransferase GcvT [Bombella sp. ESL0380]MUH03628.1 glycine cleavage system aminomethyltransferase GcvT [Bombella sp. ESL0387]QGT74363.1 glycine cleavage system aminomethyltrans